MVITAGGRAVDDRVGLIDAFLELSPYVPAVPIAVTFSETGMPIRFNREKAKKGRRYVYVVHAGIANTDAEGSYIFRYFNFVRLQFTAGLCFYNSSLN